MDLTRSRH